MFIYHCICGHSCCFPMDYNLCKHSGYNLTDCLHYELSDYTLSLLKDCGKQTKESVLLQIFKQSDEIVDLS